METQNKATADRELQTSMPVVNQTVVEEVAIIDLTFVAPLPKECLCLLCKQLMRDPCHLTCCSSTYCQNCVKRMTTTNSQCVKCSSKVYSKVTDNNDVAMKRIIQMLQAYCPMKKNGCLWSGNVVDIETHLMWGEYNPDDTTNCRYLPVPCPKKCLVVVPRREMVEHLHLGCDNRQVECEFCGFKDTATQINTVHRKFCVTRTVACPNGCKMPGIKNNRLTSHMEGECPLRHVNCDYQHIGCDEHFLFKDRVKHNERSLQEHFHLMSEKLLFLTDENDELRSLCLSVQYTCSKLQEKYDTLFSIFDAQRRREIGVQRMEEQDTSQDTYLVVNSLKRIPRRDGWQKAPVLPQRTDSMVIASVPSLEEEDTGKPSPPLPPKESKTSLTLASLSPLENDNSESVSTSSPKGDKTKKACPAKRNGSVSGDVSSSEESGSKRSPPPPPLRRDSLSTETLPQRRELRRQLRLIGRKNKSPLASPSTPLRSGRKQSSPLPANEDNLSPPVAQKQHNQSLPDLTDIKKERLENLDSDPEDDCRSRASSWSTTQMWESTDNPSYATSGSISQRYERSLVVVVDDSASDTVSTTSSDKDSPCSTDYRNFDVFTRSPPESKQAFRIPKPPKPTPRRIKSVGVEDRDLEKSKSHLSNSSDGLYRNVDSTTVGNQNDINRNGNYKRNSVGPVNKSLSEFPTLFEHESQESDRVGAVVENGIGRDTRYLTADNPVYRRIPPSNKMFLSDLDLQLRRRSTGQ